MLFLPSCVCVVRVSCRCRVVYSVSCSLGGDCYDMAAFDRQCGAPPDRFGNCQFCVFWKPDVITQHAGVMGDCRCNPPTICPHQEIDEPDYDGYWPQTLFDDWCGKFEIIPEDMREERNRCGIN
jgi:hypothetical protein